MIIVTITKRNKHHDPKNKIVGECPINLAKCTDSTGHHHTFLWDGKLWYNDYRQIHEYVKEKYDGWRVSRIEEL